MSLCCGGGGGVKKYLVTHLRYSKFGNDFQIPKTKICFDDYVKIK